MGPGAGGDKAQILARHFLDRMGPPQTPCAPGKGARPALEALPHLSGTHLSGETGETQLRTRAGSLRVLVVKVGEINLGRKC